MDGMMYPDAKLMSKQFFSTHFTPKNIPLIIISYKTWQKVSSTDQLDSQQIKRKKSIH